MHRLMTPIPQDPEQRRIEIQWLTDHPLWRHPEILSFTAENLQGMPYLEESLLRDGGKWENGVLRATVQGGSFRECLDIEFVWVDPETLRIEDEPERNTCFRVWLEAGGYFDWRGSPDCLADLDENHPSRWAACHDLYLDCGGPDLESALLRMAQLVRFHYGEGTKLLSDRAHESCSEECVPDQDGFCTVCGWKRRDD